MKVTRRQQRLLIAAVDFSNCEMSLVVTEWWFRIYISRFWHSTWTQHTVKQIVRPCSTTENTDWCASRPLGVVYSGYSRELTSSACVCVCVCVESSRRWWHHCREGPQSSPPSTRHPSSHLTLARCRVVNAALTRWSVPCRRNAIEPFVRRCRRFITFTADTDNW